MNRQIFRRIVPQALAWVAVAGLCGVIALAQDAATAGGQRTDGQIEMDVVHALDASQALKNDLITAATIQSQVTLSGTVSSDASRSLAESIVKGVPGVTGVHNNLKVGNPADDQSTVGPVDDQNVPDANSNDQGSQDQGSQQMADNGPQGAPEPPAAAPGPDYNQNQQPAYGQAPPPPAYGQNPPPAYGQAPPPPAYGQAPPPGYGQAPPPGYGQNGSQPYPPQYAQPQAPAYKFASGPVTLAPGTLLQLRTSEPVGSKRAVNGTPVQFTVIQDVTQGGVLAIPRGATVHGVVTEVKRSGELAGSSELALQLTSLDLGGQTYPIQSDQFKVKGPNKAGHTVENAVGGALLGAIIGGAVGRGEGAAIGAAAGAGAGTAASAASSGPGAWIPAEALVTFHLAAPVTVQPVDREEAMRLAQGLYPGGPTLYRRPGYYGGYGRPYYGYPYPYAPVYYRPYYFSGGFYYWR
ncbi:MAG: BON domain-containing protein [Terracidiphilus sp.]